ncbi:MAG: copper-containing nitrite reductase [Parcubacteria group bacterium]|nr:copper-containing nitrite reductase [Parcubacteria group bacterium]MCR4343018.1 copper-containing nitrite reductase [Patescibacteria group bacterium]
MWEILTLIRFVIIQGFGLFIVILVAGIFLFLVLRKLHSLRDAILLFIIFFGAFIFLYVPQGLPNSIQYPFSLTSFGPADGPVLPLGNVIKFFKEIDNMEHVSDIARDPNDIPPPIIRTEPEAVKINLETKEVIAEMAPGIVMNYWTFDGKIPGPFLRVKQGDTVELTLKNNLSSLHHHNIDLHAVTGPGGGATLTDVAPGESKTMVFKALNPGLYVYHCATANVPSHMTHGMYGLILVEPEEGLPLVDKEFYVMQGEFYTSGALGKRGLQIFDGKAMIDSRPQYIVFNGKTKSLIDNMNAEVGDTVRLFVGNGGVNLTSSFHVIGEIFDRVYPEGAIGSLPHNNIQTTLVPAGGAVITEFDLQVPGKFILVDHALSRLDRGLWGFLNVSGENNPEIFNGDYDDTQRGH